jgi:hypothetical protein
MKTPMRFVCETEKVMETKVNEIAPGVYRLP